MRKYLFKNKILLTIFILVSTLLIILILLGLLYQRENIINARKENLQILANEKAKQINSFLDSQKEKSKLLSSVLIFKELLKDPKNKIKIELAKRKIEELKNVIPGISILNNNGIVVLAEIDSPGTDYSDSLYFTLKDKHLFFESYYNPIRKRDLYVVAAPVYDEIQKDKIIGAIGFDLELEKLNNIMKETLESNGSEVYLIDRSRLLLSASEYVGRGNRHGILIQEINSDGANLCFDDLKEYMRGEEEEDIEEHEEEVLKYKNYIGNEVYGAHAYVPDIMGCIIAEEDVNDVSGF